MHKNTIDISEIRKRLDYLKIIQDLIPSAKINGKPDVLGLCPNHDDTHPSLSINTQTLLFNCFSCGFKGDIFTLYQKVKGVDFPTALKELAVIAGVTDASKPKVVATFKYTDMGGNLLYTKERIEPGRNGKSKEFIFKHQDNGKWALGRGCEPVLYRLPELLSAKEVFIVEGEHKAGLLHSWGLTATCLDSGANSPWRAEYSEAFKGKESVTILPDKDKPGNEYALKIASALHDKVGSLKVVELPELQGKDDIIDWAAIPGNDKGKLITIIEGAAEWNLARATEVDSLTMGLTHARDLLTEVEEETDWLIEGLLPSGGFSVITAKPKVGKSTLVKQMALNIAKGLPFLGREVMQGAIIYLALEDKRSEIKKHLRAMGMTANDPFYLYAGGAPLDAIKRITADIAAIKPVLLVVDTLFRLIRLKDGNSYNEVTNALNPLLLLARESGVSILAVHHSKKGDSNIDDCLLGSTAIFGSVDTTILLKRYEGYRTIQSMQRYGEDMPETVLVFDKAAGSTDIGGAKIDQDIHSMENAIFEFLSKQTEPVIEKVITDEVLGKTALKRKALRQLVKEGQIFRTGKGGKGSAFHYSCSPENACSQEKTETGNNKNSQKNDPEKNACSLVPKYTGGQQKKKDKSGCEPHGYWKDSCSHVPAYGEQEKKQREQAFSDEKLTLNSGENPDDEIPEIEFLEVK